MQGTRCISYALLAAAICALPASGDTTKGDGDREAPAKVFRIMSSSQRIAGFFDADNYAGAAAYIEELLRHRPMDAALLYDAARVNSRLGELDAAAAYLMQALKAGYRGFSHIRRDPDLTAIRNHAVFRAIIDARNFADDTLADRSIQRWDELLGEDRYDVVEDRQRKLIWFTPIQSTSRASDIGRVERLYDDLVQELFDSRQEHFVTTVLLNWDDRQEVLNRDHAGGVYRHEERELVALDTRTALPHEIVHVLHQSHMDRLGQEHAMWVQEGMASLFEAFDFLPDGGWRFIPTERQLIAQRLEREDRLMPLTELLRVDYDDIAFDAPRCYAQFRCVMRYIDEKVGVATFYATYIASFDADPSGQAALEQVFDQPLEDIDRHWRTWLADQAVELGPG